MTRTPGWSAPGTGMRVGSAPVASSASRYSSVAPAGDRDLAPVGVEADRAAADQRDSLLAQPVLGLERQLVLAHLAAQQLLGQRRTAIGHPVLVGDDRHGCPHLRPRDSRARRRFPRGRRR